MKKILMSLLVIALMLGVVGVAFATNAEFSNVGALSLGRGYAKDVDVSFVGYELETGFPDGVRVDGVYLAFTENLGSQQHSTIIFVSLRGYGSEDANELAYCVAVVPKETTLVAGTIYKFPCADLTYALPEDVRYVKVTVAEQSAYVAGTQAIIGEDPSVATVTGAAP